MYETNPIIRIANALIPVSVDNFDSRLKLQKIGFLAQEMGADTGFAFNWYRRGPYSPSLTRVLYSAEELGQLRIPNVRLTPSERKIADGIHELLGDDIDDPDALELVASVWYFLVRTEVTTKNTEQILNTLVEEKPRFPREELRRAMQQVMRFRQKTPLN